MASIVLIDDDHLVREMLKIALGKAGHNVVVAANGAHVEGHLFHNKPDIVVTDLLMPECDGLETIQRIRKSNASVKVIAISGGGRTKNLDLLSFAKTFGADAVLPKPFLPGDLVELIDRLSDKERTTP